MIRTRILPLSIAFVIITCNNPVRTYSSDFHYRSPAEIDKLLQAKSADSGEISYQSLGRSPGGREISVLTIGSGQAGAIMAAANMTGESPLGSEAALKLADYVMKHRSGVTGEYTWYIIPCGNPDGYARFFERPLAVNAKNLRPFNDDNDDAVDEDGPEDLNGDGRITVMRQEDPGGKWTESERYPGILRRAESAKGEGGKYRLLPEGIDNDGDGEINEDGLGGVNPGHNFPHNFEHYTDSDGLWAGSEEESRAVMRFAFDHPEIAMMLVFDRSNTLLNIPPDNKQGGANKGKYKVPERYAKQLGVDPQTELPLGEITQMLRELWSSPNLTEDRVRRILGGGAMVNPDKQDLPYWKEISSIYGDFLDSAGIETERIDPPGLPPGSIEEWSYYQYGVPTFAMDFWTLPKPKPENEEDKPKSEDNDEVEEWERALYEFSPEAFLRWEEFQHPDLGKVEIGGVIPYAETVAPAAMVAGLIDAQLPFVEELAGRLPKLTFGGYEVEKRNGGHWKVKVWVKNEGYLPYPTYQGKRSKRPVPAVVTLEGGKFEIIEGKARNVLGLIEGSGGIRKTEWLVKGKEGSTITVNLTSPSAGSDELSIKLKEGEGR